MINLIPPSARTQVKQEYWIRVGSVWMILIAIALCMVALLLVPVFVLVKKQQAVFGDQFASAQDTQAQFSAAADLLKNANDAAALLSGGQTDFMPSAIFETVNSVLTSEIIITQYNISKKEGVQSVAVIGQATSRTALAAFRDALESHPRFASAELPLANLAKDVDILFNITVTLAPQE